MRKHLKKQYTRILILLLIAAFILLLILFFGFYDELMTKFDVLVKLTEQQTTQIINLENELHNLEVANAKLQHTVNFQHEQLQEYKLQGNTMTFDLRPKEVTMEDLHNEIEPQLHKEEKFWDSSTVTAAIMGTLLMLKGTVGLFLPAIQ